MKTYFVNSRFSICFRYCTLLVLLFANALNAQQTRLITGILRDNSGNPIPGVNIVIKGTATGTLTDANGFYSIEAPVGSTLVVSFVGFLSEEIYVGPEEEAKKPDIIRKKMNITAKTDSVRPEEPVRIFRHTIPDGNGKTLSPYFFIRSDDPETDKMPLKSTSAEVNIAGVIADVTVKQVYVNEGMNTLEAIYIFPGSSKAAVYGMTMKIGDRMIKAKIKEKEAARVEYETARKEGKTATLLEQKRPNVFQMNVANILSGDTIEVELFYTEMLESLDGIYQFVYPAVVGPRYSETPDTETNKNENWVNNPYLHQGDSPPYTFNLKINVNTGMPIQKIYCSSHQTNISFVDRDKAEIKLDGSEKYGGNRDFILNYGLRGGKVESGILLHENGDENFFLLMMEPPISPQPEDIPPREYIFIVDVSGSMNGFPLNISKSTMKNLLNRLNEKDKFNILTFAGGSKLLWNESRPATSVNILYGTNFMNLQIGGGGTRLLDALERTLKISPEEGYSRTLVVLTDGYVDFEKETFIRVRENLNQANLFAIGIGSSVNRYLIEGLAHAGMGEPFIATSEQEGRKVGNKLIEYIETPVLTDISVDFGKFGAYDYEPASIPDIFARRPILIYGKYSGNAEGTIKIHGYTGNVPYVKSFNLKNASKEDNQALRYLWARNMVRYLDDYAHYYTNPVYSSYNNNKPAKTTEQVREITRLGLKYNILTQYTSFIAVDSMFRNKSGKSETVKQPLPLPQGVSDLAVGNSLPSKNVNTGYLSGNNLNMSLVEDINKLDEVVVIGYGTQKKSDVTASISSVSSSEIISTGNVLNSLQGRASGIEITNNNGGPGSGNTVHIRGLSSISGTQQPLYVINGTPVSANDDPALNPVLNINPEDIESIEILKDASSSSVYGSRGAGGVILINTRKGTTGKKEIVIDANTGISGISKTFGSRVFKDAWYSDLKQTGANQKIYLSAQQGREKYQYLVSLGYNKEKGILKHTGMKRITGNLSFSSQLFKDRINAGISTVAGYSHLNDFLPVSDYSGLGQIVVERNYMNIIGKTYLNICLFDNLILKNTINGTLNSKKLSPEFANEPVSSSDLINDNLRFNDLGISTGLFFEKNIHNHSFALNGIFEAINFHNIYNNNSSTPETSQLKLLREKYLLQSYLLKIHYNYNDKYLVNANFRKDDSQRFKTENKSIILPSLGVAWNIGNEQFLGKVVFISNLKLRYSWGILGNCQLPYYPSSLLIPLSLNDSVPVLMENRNLRWEKNRQHNFGLDLALIRNRISLTAEYFSNKTSDAYYLDGAEIYSGIFQWINAGDFINRGFDISLNTHLLAMNNWNLKVFLNVSRNKTMITRINDEIRDLSRMIIPGVIAGQIFKKGDPLGVYYGLETQLIDEVNKEIVFKDIDRNGIINESDIVKIADSNPKLYGGGGFEISYKNFEILSFWKMSTGNDVINVAGNKYRSGSYTDNRPPELLTVITDNDVENGSYIRLSELTFGYSLPKHLLNNLKFNAIKFKLSAANLLTFSKYSGQDPEFNNWIYQEREAAKILPGIDRGYYPISRTILFGIQACF